MFFWAVKIPLAKTWTNQVFDHFVELKLGVPKFWLKPTPKLGYTKALKLVSLEPHFVAVFVLEGAQNLS